MLVLAIKSHRYCGKVRKPGDEYRITGKSDLHLFKALGWVIDQEVPDKTSIQAPVIRAVPVVQVVEEIIEKDEALVDDQPISTPEQGAEVPEENSSAVAENVAVEVKPKRAYKRRDLSAE